MIFVGRRHEMAKMERLYSNEGSSVCAIYGRRRVGKTALIQRFCEGKQHVFLTSMGRTKEVVLYNYSASLNTALGGGIALKDEYELIDLLRMFISGDGKPIVVFDEFPSLVKLFPDSPALLQRFIDVDMREHTSMLIVSGSAIGAMRECLEEGDSPLFMRFPDRMKILPMTYLEAREFHPGLSEEDMIRAYAIAGGIPAYHAMIGDRDVRKAISSDFLSTSGFLESEAESVLSLELKPWDSYDRILQCMGNGPVGLSDIIATSGMSKTHCVERLDSLVELGIVAVESPFGMVRNSAYRIVDGLTAFHYCVAVRCENIIALNREDPYGAAIERIDTFFDWRFEEICKQYLAGTRRCTAMGRWWGKAPVLVDGMILRDGNKAVTESVDIDIVATVAGSDAHITEACECKFTGKPITADDILRLKRRSEVLKAGTDIRFVVFSRSGFSDGARNMSEDDSRIELVDMDSIKEWARRGRGIRDSFS